jgi:hypothetical protein
MSTQRPARIYAWPAAGAAKYPRAVDPRGQGVARISPISVIAIDGTWGLF